MAITFILGYWTGYKNHQSPLETENTLTNKDMEHAFGSIKPSSHEPVAESQGTMVMSLGELVDGLEKKVAANPDNLDQQLLLAQTYKELGNREKGLSLLQSLNKRISNNSQVKFTLATMLMNGEDKNDLKQASQLFDEAIKLEPELASKAKLFQGEINVRLKSK